MVFGKKKPKMMVMMMTRFRRKNQHQEPVIPTNGRYQKTKK